MSSTAEDDLQRAGTADQPRQPLRSAAAGNDADRDLRLGQPRLAERSEAHVERQREFAAATARDAFDDGDRRLRHGAEQLRQLRGTATARREVWCRRVGSALDQRDVRMGDEEVRVGRVDDDTRTSSSAATSAANRPSSVIRSASSRLIGGLSIVARQMPSADRDSNALVVVVGHAARS